MSIQKSNEINELIKAIGKFQSKKIVIDKNADNPFHKSKYADYNHILNVIQPHLTDCDLVLQHFIIGDTEVHSIVSHSESGQFMSTTFNLNPVEEITFGDKYDEVSKKWIKPRSVDNIVKREITPQTRASAITYAKRISTAALLNLNIGDEFDDDGNSSSDVKSRAEDKAQKAVEAVQKVTQKASLKSDVTAETRQKIKNLLADTELSVEVRKVLRQQASQIKSEADAKKFLKQSLETITSMK